jgi:1-pyrroline-5-carboxylate dehydrogenase
MTPFRLTYSTMFQPPEALHALFQQALVRVRQQIGRSHALHIDGRDLPAARAFTKTCPIDVRCELGQFASAGAPEVDAAMQAAHRAWGAWRRSAWSHRVELAHRTANLIEERVYDIAAAVALEVGKNRMEAIGEVQEVADFFRIYADDMARHAGFELPLPDDPLENYKSRNRSVLKPYGVWGVIAPFNFPFALSGGPVAAALVAGNTVVLKSPSDAPWSGRLLADCIRDAGYPPGVFNFLSGSGREAGKALIEHPLLAGVTFTGSYETGMGIYRGFAAGRYPRPAILEMGGKNAAIVTRHGDLERAALGIVRSGYGLSGQKCSALSRVYVEEPVADELLQRVRAEIARLVVGDPTARPVQMGPVAHDRAARDFERYSAQLRAGARVLEGAERLRGPVFDHGLYCAPTLAEADPDHPLFAEELFLPIVMVARVPDKEAAMAAANAVDLGLTAGMYGNEEELAWFLDNIEAGVTYCNRPQGATTGAWPGYQPFGGWKGSGSTGKGIASAYYLPLYLREQSQTIVE